MHPLRLKIQWRSAREFIRLDLDRIDENTQSLRTEEDWLDGSLLHPYRPRLQYRRINDGSLHLTLDYLQQDHPEYEGVRVIWGQSKITISPTLDSATVEWTSSPPRPEEDGLADCLVVEERMPSEAERESIRRLKRAQAKFKNSILPRESVCAASGESFQPALEAAHIQDVEDRGPNIPENGFLLRADLHKLFDDGFFTLSEDGFWTFDNAFPEGYRGQFISDRVCQSTFERVKDFIAKRRPRSCASDA